MGARRLMSEKAFAELRTLAHGGIPMPFPEPDRKDLVDSVESCTERVLHLLQRPGECEEFTRAGREHVRRQFLIPRLVRNERRLIKQVLEAS